MSRIWLLNIIGDERYSIYVWHTMIFSLATWIAHLLGLAPIPTIAFGVAAGVTGGIVGYFLLEIPLRAWFRRRPKNVPA